MNVRKAAEQALEALIWESEGRLLDVVPKITADAIDALRAALTEDGWRQCAEGQKTTQFCGLLEKAVIAEREACAKVCEPQSTHDDPLTAWKIAETIRARGMMTREKIIKMAREAGLCTWEVIPDAEAKKLEHFAGLIAIVANTERDDDYASVTAAEREACAAFLETGVDMAGLAGDPRLTKYTFELLTACAAAIRARAGK